MRLLFVCLGNICRSPSAEAIMNKLIAEAGLSHLIDCDSAGTSAYHEGEPADRRMGSALKARGYESTSRSRPVESPYDYQEFDYILAMDRQNYQNLMELAPQNGSYKAKIHLMCDFCETRREKEVPDPYYGGADGFNHVIDILEDACSGLLKKIKSEIKA